MFTAADLEKRCKKVPFMPFRIVTSSGESYDILHPEFLMIGKRLISVGIATDANARIFDDLDVLSVLHITAIEVLPQNGTRKRR
jgi:hypothetical protein